jgi:hypothetical protein
MEAFSIASAAVSVVLGIYAIWLSIVFYRMSVETSNRIQESSKDLGSSVNKLERLFEHLYSDTFSMMRDTYSDMRKHVWPETTVQEPEVLEQIETRADAKIDNIRTELINQIEAVATQAGGTDEKVSQLRKEISPLVDKAISRSRSAETEAEEETLRDFLTSHIRSAGRDGVRAIDLSNYVGGKNARWSLDFFSEIRNLKEEGIIISVPDDPETIAPRDRFYVPNASPRRSRAEDASHARRESGITTDGRRKNP